jgi:aminoglycoside 3-N-acetyltransferase
MAEKEVIQKTKDGPRTLESLISDFGNLGLKPGMVLLVHSSLSSIGWISGGPVAVIQALIEILGKDGTLVMPTHSGDLTDPEKWENPPVPEEWKEIIRETMPAFEPDLTPTRGMGKIPETFRKMEGVLRSNHPHDSFAALGRDAEFITKSHEIDFGLGEGSPLARIYDLDGWVLLLGVGHDNNTSLHLAEFRADYPSKKVVQQGGPIIQDGKRTWVRIKSLEENTDDFINIGKAYQQSGKPLWRGIVGNAKATLFPQRDLVDFAARWMSENRQ